MECLENFKVKIVRIVRRTFFFSKSAATDFFEDAEAAKNLSKVGKIVSFVNLGFIFYLTFIFGSNNQV